MRRGSPSPSSASLVKKVSMNSSFSHSATMLRATGVTPPLVQAQAWHLRVAVQDQNHSAVPKHFVGAEQFEQARHQLLELRIAQGRSSFDLGQDQLPQEPGRLVDTELLAEVLDGPCIATEQGVDVRLTRLFAE